MCSTLDTKCERGLRIKIFLSSHEPSNPRALEGMQKMEAAPDTVEPPPYMEVEEDIADSEVRLFVLF